MGQFSELNPCIKYNRNQWCALHELKSLPITESESLRFQNLGKYISSIEIEEIYLPLAKMIYFKVINHKNLFALNTKSLGNLYKTSNKLSPFIIGITGSVAVGKSTTARILQILLSRWNQHIKVDLVTTDGFLYSNKELSIRNIMHRKGFPESYNKKALMKFIATIKSGIDKAYVPTYSHLYDDILPEQKQIIQSPDILILEGLNILQPEKKLMLSKLLDFSIYVDAYVKNIKKWYIFRFLNMRNKAITKPISHFYYYSKMKDEKAIKIACNLWDSINKPNLIENIQPTKLYANLVLKKDSNHSVTKIKIRKL